MLIFNKDFGLGTMNDQGGGAVINNQDMTITTNGEYTADEGYTGIGTATVNVPEADVITATNNTGSAISEGDKVWIKENGGIYSIENYYTDVQMFEIAGSPTITNKVASNFSRSNYLGLIQNYLLSAGNVWEVYCKFTPQTMSTGCCIYTVGTVNYPEYEDSAVYMGTTSNGTALYCKTNGNVVGIIEMPTSTFYTKVVGDGTNTSFYYSTTGYDNMTLAGTISGSINIGKVNVYLGCNGTYSGKGAFVGSIYLEDFKIVASNASVWKLYAINADAENFVTGAAKESIASGSTGQVETVLPE